MGILTGLRPRAERTWRRAAHFGTRYQCPLCHASVQHLWEEGEKLDVLNELDVVGGGFRPSVVCPVCWSTDRERLVFVFLRSRPELMAGRPRLMHIAPERELRGWLRRELGGHYLTADLMEPDVDANFDLTAIPFPDAHFDAAMVNHIMEHIPDDAQAMREVLRTLKPGGWAIMQVPIARKLDVTIEDPSVTDPAERERRFGQHDHIRIYTADDYAVRLARAGFDVERFEWWAHRDAFGGPTNRYGLLERETLFFVRRPVVAA